MHLSKVMYNVMFTVYSQDKTKHQLGLLLGSQMVSETSQICTLVNHTAPYWLATSPCNSNKKQHSCTQFAVRKVYYPW